MGKQPRKDGPRLIEVADRAGVSVSTASMALGAKGRISREVRDRVRRAADDLGYIPVARSDQRVQMSGVLFLMDRQWAWTFNMLRAILESLEASLQEAGRQMTIIPISESEPLEKVKNKVMHASVDSVFSIHYADGKLFQEIENIGIPVVLIMNNNFQNVFNSVCSDDFQGGYEAGRILVDQGHRNMAYVSTVLPLLTAVRTDRMIGFRKALDEAGLVLPDTMDSVCDLSSMGAADDAVECLMSTSQRPSALYIMDDYIGIRVYQALLKRGVAVPEDVSIICAGDVLDYSEPFIPNLSTMRIQFETMGRAAAEMMLSHLKAPSRIRQHEVLKVKQHYIDRGTVRPWRA
jgi:LacI family transcriptional regulator